MATLESDRNRLSNSTRSNLSTLPAEVQLLVYGSLGDLDDAIALSRTCGYYLRLFRGSKRAIARAIVVRLLFTPRSVVSYRLHTISCHQMYTDMTYAS